MTPQAFYDALHKSDLSMESLDKLRANLEFSRPAMCSLSGDDIVRVDNLLGHRVMDVDNFASAFALVRLVRTFGAIAAVSSYEDKIRSR